MNLCVYTKFTKKNHTEMLYPKAYTEAIVQYFHILVLPFKNVKPCKPFPYVLLYFEDVHLHCQLDTGKNPS